MAAIGTLFSTHVQAAAAGHHLKVAASSSIVSDLAKYVGDKRIDITTLAGPDGDAHVYEPRPSDEVNVAGSVASKFVVTVHMPIEASQQNIWNSLEGPGSRTWDDASCALSLASPRILEFRRSRT